MRPPTAKRPRRSNPVEQDAGQKEDPSNDAQRLTHTLRIRVTDAQHARFLEMGRLQISLADYVRQVLDGTAGPAVTIPRGSSQDYRATLHALARVETLLGAVVGIARRAQARGEPADLDALRAGVDEVRALGQCLLPTVRPEETDNDHEAGSDLAEGGQDAAP